MTWSYTTTRNTSSIGKVDWNETIRMIYGLLNHLTRETYSRPLYWNTTHSEIVTLLALLALISSLAFY